MPFNEYEREIKNENDNLSVVIQDAINTANKVIVDATGALKVTGAGGGEQYPDGQSDTGVEKGNIALGSDGSNFKYLLTDSSGRLQIDAISLPNINLASQANPFTNDINVSLDGETIDLSSQVWPFTDDAPITLDGEQVDISDRAARDLGKVDIAAFDVSLPSGDNIIGRSKITDGTNVVDVLNDSGTYRLQVEAKVAPGGAEQNVVITDPITSSYQANVDSSGRLQVSTQPPTPVTSTPVSGTADGTHSGAVTTYFTLSTTLDTTVQKFIGGGEGSKATKVELFEDATGTGSPLVLLAKGFIPQGGGNVDFDLNEQFTANGTRRLAIVRTMIGGGNTETFAQWSGFEV